MYSPELIETANKFINNAYRDLRAAENSKQSQDYEAANSRAYYAIFNAIRAVLALENAEFKTHSRTIGHFNKNYIHAGVFSTNFSKIISLASETRNNSDYDVHYEASYDDAELVIADAGRFLEAMAEYVSTQIHPERSDLHPFYTEPENEDEIEL